MNLLTYFDYEKTNAFSIYRFKPGNKDKFLSEITSEFRLCYITDKLLVEKAKENEISKSKFLEEYILPSKGNIKSGDFGEMLSCFFIIEHYSFKDILLIVPRKWRWKEDRNKASPYSDAVGFYREDENIPTENDFVVCVESKMNATKPNINRIQEAIDGANEDRLSRLAKTLIWLRERYAKDGNIKMRKLIERYTKPVEKKTYQKIFKAFSILDKEFEISEISQPIDNADGISIIIVSMEELKNIYESNLKRIIESV